MVCVKAEQGKSTGAPQKITSHHDRALFQNGSWRSLQECPRITNHHRFRLDWAWRWKNSTVAAWSHVIWGDESRFQLYAVDGGMIVLRLSGNASSNTARVQAGRGSVYIWGHSTGVPSHTLCSWIRMSMAQLCIGISCGIPWYYLLDCTL